MEPGKSLEKLRVLFPGRHWGQTSAFETLPPT